MAGNSKNKSNKYLLIGLAAALVVLVVLVVVLVRVFANKNNNDTSAKVNVSKAGSIVNAQVETRDSSWDTQRVDATVEIQMDDFAAVVGTQVKVVALVTPVNTDLSLTWSSSNNGVFTVTNEGVVIVRGTGTAVLTATAGNVSDSIVIEGIDSVASGSVNNLPIYTASNGDIAYADGQNYNNGSQAEQNTQISYENQNGQNQTNQNQNGQNQADQNQNGQNQTDQNGQNNQAQQPTDSNSNNNSNNSSNNSSNNNSNINPTGGNGGYNSNNIGEVLPSNGFTPVISNVYTYEENGQYYGEIVTQPNVTIIYIKQRGAGFDSKVQSVIASMIPESSSQVWSTYQTANTDKTFVADNKKVRIVVAAGGGHSQIVIYN